MVQRAALANIGIARLPEMQAAEDIRAGRLCRLLPDFEPERTRIHVVYPSRRHLAPRVRVTIDFIVEQAHRLLSRPDSDRSQGNDDATRLP